MCQECQSGLTGDNLGQLVSKYAKKWQCQHVSVLRGASQYQPGSCCVSRCQHGPASTKPGIARFLWCVCTARGDCRAASVPRVGHSAMPIMHVRSTNINEHSTPFTYIVFFMELTEGRPRVMHVCGLSVVRLRELSSTASSCFLHCCLPLLSDRNVVDTCLLSE